METITFTLFAFCMLLASRVYQLQRKLDRLELRMDLLLEILNYQFFDLWEVKGKCN